MKPLGVHHVGITVPDLDAAIDFYLDVLGLDMADPPSPIFDNPELGPAVGVSGGALRQVNLRAGDAVVELIEYTAPPEPSPEPIAANSRGAAHLALRVEDVNAAKAELEGLGVEFLSKVNVVDEGVLAGWRWVYFRDPAGIVLELVEAAYRLDEQNDRAVDDYLRARPEHLITTQD